MKRRLKTFLSVTASVILFIEPPLAYALPTGGQVAGGQASISSQNNTLTIDQSSQKAIINWNSFNIGNSEIVQFVQPSSSAIALNRINDTQASTINGQLLANGNVWLLNPNGVLFGKNAQVNVGGLLATSSNISDSNFFAGLYNFTSGGNPNAIVSNEGSVSVAQGGLADFVAPNVINSGIINARLGKVALASGDSFTLDMYGDNLINLQISDSVESQLVANHGTVNVDGGIVSLTTAAAANVVNSLINMDGIIQANSVGTQNGQVVLYAAGSNAVTDNVAANKGNSVGSSTTLVSGTINATGYNSGQAGGTVQVLGDNVGVLTGTKIDVSGDARGGTIQVGGDYHGQGTTPTALNTIVQSGTQLLANAVHNGDGGNVTVWADNSTAFAGTIEAMGGTNSGNGGFIETSGKQYLGVSGSVNASAPKGMAGTWLMDPNNVTITTSPTNNMGSSPNFSDTGSSANVNTADIVSALNGGTSVNVTASGSIALENSISENTYSGSESLTLKAGSDITVYNNANITASGPTQLNVTLDANMAGSGGAIAMYGGSGIATNGGNIVIGGGASPLTEPAVGDAANSFVGIGLSGTTLNAGSGNITLTGVGAGTGNYAHGIYIGDSTISTTTGNISITGTAASGGGSGSFGIQMTDQGGSTLISSAGGSISLVGTGGGAGSGNHGIEMDGASRITGTGNTGITLNGTGGDGTGSDFGIYLNTSATSISAQNGDISLTGMGGNNTQTEDIGVAIASPITTTGTGNIVINGTGGSGTGGNSTGVQLWGAGNVTPTLLLTTNNGDINITGQGGGNGSGSGNSSIGIGSASNLKVSSTGTGNITMNGTGGGQDVYGIGIGLSDTTISTNTGNITLTGMGATQGANASFGIQLAGWSWSTLVNSAGGTISLTGTGGAGTGGGENGIELDGKTQITGTGSSGITLDGTGGGTGSGIGINLNTSTGYGITAQNGLITLTGTGATNAGGSNIGVQVNSGGISSTGTGGVIITGTGGADTNGGDDGIDMWGGFITVANNSLSMTGYGGGVGGVGQGTGIFTQGTSLTSTGSGSISLSGTGGTGDYNSGIAIVDSQISTGSSNITMLGTGATNGVNAYGIYLATNSSSNVISSTGGVISLTGTGGAGTGGGDNGIEVAGNSQITGTGNASILITGTGGAASGDGVTGVAIDDNAIINTQNGTITINGTGGNTSGNYDAGVEIGGYSSGQVTSTAGNITITGTGGGTGSYSDGIDMFSGAVTTTSGNISMTGYGEPNGTGGNGIGLNGGTVSSTGSGNITLAGTGVGGAGRDIGSTGSPNYLGSSTMTGNLTIISNNTFSDLSIQNNGGIVTLKPRTNSLAIGINHSSGFGTLSDVNSAFLSLIDTSTASPGLVVVGNSTSGTGAVTIGNGWDIHNYSFPVDIYGGSITTGGITMGGYNLLLDSLAGNTTINAGSSISKSTGGNALLTLDASGDIISNGNSGSHVNISSTSSNLGVVLDADTAAGGGAVNLAYTSITSNGGNITIGGGANAANDPAVGDAANNDGVVMNGSTLNTGNGNVVINGSGYAGVAGANGIALLNSQVSTTSGNITMNGTGGANGNNNNGIDLDGTSGTTIVSSSAGTISLTGTGGSGTGQVDQGIVMNDGAQITATNNATITLDGTGGGSYVGMGVALNSAAAVISTQNGDIDITGQGANNPSGFGIGVYIGNRAPAYITSTGTGKINITGTANAISGTGTNDGVDIWGGVITANNGNVTINGQGAGNAQGAGVYFANSASITSNGAATVNVTGTGGGASSSDGILFDGGQITTSASNITVNGTGGATGSSNNGINFAGSTNTISSSGGAISLTGVGGSDSTGQVNQGIDMNNGNNQINGTGGSAISLNGTGGGNYVGIGIVLNQSSDSISAQNGNITLTGQGGSGTAGYNIGVLVGDNNTGEISSTGTGTITIAGTAGSGTGGGNNNGVDIWSGVVTSGTGNIAVTGHGGVNSGDTGIDIVNSGTVSSTGSANITLTGVAGANGLYGITSSGGSNVLGGGSMTGNLTLIADTLNLSNIAINTSGTGTITFLPYTLSTPIGVAGGAGTLNISDSILGDISTTGGVVIGSTSDTGLMNVGYTGWGVPVTFNNGTNDIDISNGSGVLSFTHAANANTTTGNIDFSATTDVALNNGGNIITQGGNVTFDSDKGGAGGSDILINTNVTTHGGNIIIGGGANPAIGSAVGTTSNYSGVAFSGVVLDAGTGNISLIGTGWASPGTNSLTGISLASSTLISTTTGNITMNGTGGNGYSDSYGVNIDDSTISSSGGNISLTGQANTNTAGNHDVGIILNDFAQVNATGNATISLSGTGSGGDNGYGVFLTGNASISGQNGNVSITGQGGNNIHQYNDGIVVSEGAVDSGSINMNGTGTLTLNGTGGAGTGDHNYGVILDHGTVTATNGNINITGQGGVSGGSLDVGVFLGETASLISAGSGNINITALAGGGTTAGFYSSLGNNALGGNSMTGNLTIAADGISLSNLGISTAGIINLKPYTNSTPIGINGGAGALGDVNSGFLGFINTGTVSPSQVNIGNAVSGSGAVTIGAGWNISGYSFPINVYGGSITSGSITGGTKPLLLDALAGNITLNSGAALTSTSTGTGLTLVAADNFINNSNSSVLSDSNGQWLVYSTNPANNTLNGLTSSFFRYSCTYGGSCPTFPASGSGLLYTYAPTLTATPNTINLTYGDAAPSLTGYAYTLTGYIGSDSSSDSISGSLNGTTTYAQYDNVGSYNINHSGGTLSSLLGYVISYANNSTAISVAAKTLNVTLTGLVDKVYDATTSATLAAGNYSLSGVIHGDTVNLNDPTSGTYDTQNVGSGKTVSVSGLSISGSGAGNYTLASTSVNGAVGKIDKATLTVTADNATREDDQSNPVFTGNITGFKGGDNSSVLTTQPIYTTSATNNSPAGFYSIVPSGASASNYAFSYVDGTLTITSSGAVQSQVIPPIPSTVKFISAGAAEPTYINGLQDYLVQPALSDLAGLYGIYGNSSPLNVEQHNHIDSNSSYTPLAQEFSIDCKGSNKKECIGQIQ